MPERPMTLEQSGWVSVIFWAMGRVVLSLLPSPETLFETMYVLVPLSMGWLFVGSGLLMGTLAIGVVCLQTAIAFWCGLRGVSCDAGRREVLRCLRSRLS
jgi:hypothetical protein